MSSVQDTMKLIEELPEELQKQVADFARFLAQKNSRPKRTKLRLDWAGGLRDLRDKYTSVELQHKATGWFGAVGREP